MSNSILFSVKPLPLIASIKRTRLSNSIIMTVLLSLLAACSGNPVIRPSKEIQATAPTSKQSTTPMPASTAQLPIGGENSSKTSSANKTPAESANIAIINPGTVIKIITASTWF